MPRRVGFLLDRLTQDPLRGGSRRASTITGRILVTKIVNQVGLTFS
jgi:hypothetical protein